MIDQLVCLASKLIGGQMATLLAEPRDGLLIARHPFADVIAVLARQQLHMMRKASAQFASP